MLRTSTVYYCLYKRLTLELNYNMDSELEVFKSAGLTQKRAFLLKCGIWLPSRASSAGSDETFMMSLYLKSIIYVTAQEVKDCKYAFEFDVKLDGLAIMCYIAHHSNMSVEVLKSAYGVDATTKPDNFYLMMLLHKIKPECLLVQMFNCFPKRNAIRITTEADLVTLYNEGKKHFSKFSANLSDLDKRLINDINHMADFAYKMGKDFPDMLEAVDHINTSVQASQKKKGFDKLCLNNFYEMYNVFVPEYRLYRQQVQVHAAEHIKNRRL